MLVLRQAVALGTKVVVHLRLSLDDKEADGFKDLAFATAEPFRVLSLGCREKQYPVTPGGARYTKEQEIACPGQRAVIVEFSAPPKVLGPVEGRNLLRFGPTVANLAFNLQGRTLEVTGDFAWETLYSVSLAQAPLQDQRGRTLEIADRSEVFLHFPRRPAYVRLTQGYGLVERLGPQMVPVDGRGQERLDLRIHKIDPLDRSFWPFPRPAAQRRRIGAAAGPRRGAAPAHRPLAQPDDTGAAAEPAHPGLAARVDARDPALEARGQHRHLRPRRGPPTSRRPSARGLPAPTSWACATWRGAATVSGCAFRSPTWRSPRWRSRSRCVSR